MGTCKTDFLFRKADIRQTKKRRLILETLHDFSLPFSAYDLHKKLSETEKIDLATVYRSLNLFYEKGLLRIVSKTGDFVRYEVNCEHNPEHPHFICESCDSVECLPASKVCDISKMASGKKVTHAQITLRGICEQCQEK